MSGILADPRETGAPVDRRRHRLPELDAVRGLAVLLMIGDHVALFAGDWMPYRYTLGRVAMPVFFLLAGFLFRRMTRRHAGILALGVLLTAVAPWAGAPSILVQLVVALLVLRLWRWAGLPAWVLAAVGLTFGANGFGVHGGMYEQAALVGLVALGSLLPLAAWSWGSRLPVWVAWIGARPLWVYVGHVVVLTVVGVNLGLTA